MNIQEDNLKFIMSIMSINDIMTIKRVFNILNLKLYTTLSFIQNKMNYFLFIKNITIIFIYI